MSLRTKLLILFGALAIVPLLTLTVFEYVRSVNAVRDLLGAQTTAVAQRVAARATERLALLQGDLALLSQNADTRRFLGSGRGRDSALAFVRSVMAVMNRPPTVVTFRNTAGATLEARVDGSDTSDTGGSRPMWPMLVPVVDDDGRSIGSMTAMVPVDAIMPPELLNDRVGIGGYTVAVDRIGRRVLPDPNHLGAPDRGAGALEALAAARPRAQTIGFTEHDSARVASVADIGDSGLAVLAVSTVAEFSAPLADVRELNLVLALFITASVGLAFVILAGRVSRPVEALTRAADQVGRGNFEPDLPPDGPDEVGRLSASFRRMSSQVRDMMRQLESSRQMAAIGAFSAQIAHEIRNPLTSIKLNLQSIERDLNDGAVTPSARRPIEICMAEIQRLDKVVRGVLRLGRTERNTSERFSVHRTLRAAADLTHDQLASHGITLELRLEAHEDEVIGDAGELRGVLLNLLLNAAEALERGGCIRVMTEGVTVAAGRAIQVRIADDGPGVPAAARESIFEPFYTTKSQGSGLGLAIAARDVENHRGRLSLAEQPGELGGATFVVELPLAETTVADEHT